MGNDPKLLVVVVLVQDRYCLLGEAADSAFFPCERQSSSVLSQRRGYDALNLNSAKSVSNVGLACCLGYIHNDI